MTSLIVSIAVPIASALTGSGITYLLNVSAQDRREKRKLFEQAIIAVRIAVASEKYVRGYGKTDSMTAADHKKMQSSIDIDAIMNNRRRIEGAQYAIAQVSEHEPRLHQYVQDPSAIQESPDEVIGLLEHARDEYLKRRKRRKSRGKHNPWVGYLFGKTVTPGRANGQISCPERTSGSIPR